MADEALKEVLCIPGKRRNYAVEFPYVEEICKDVMISLMPCLPGHFAGVCNYKGASCRWSARKALRPAGKRRTPGRWYWSSAIRDIFWASFCIRSHI
ncbi:MAG: hypothetical protein ACLTW9_02910 [Enterocloster sp.]